MQNSDFELLMKSRWVRIQMLEDIQVDRCIKGVLRAIDSHARDKIWCWPSCQTIGNHIGISERSATRHIGKAIKGDWIKVKKNPGRSNHYAINWNQIFDSLPEEKQAVVLDRIKQKPQRITASKQTAAIGQRKITGLSSFPAGYSPAGMPPQASRKTNQENRKPKLGRRWKFNINSNQVREPMEVNRLFKQAADLGFVNLTEHARREIWSLAVHCRKADNPGGLFRHQLERNDFSKVTDQDEKIALKEIKTYDKKLTQYQVNQ